LKITSITMVGNECDIIESFVRYTSQIADRMIFVYDKGCIDDSLDILRRLQGEGLAVELYDESRYEYEQQVMENKYLLHAAADEDTDIILPLDADEFLSADISPRMALQKLDIHKAYEIKWRVYYPQADDDEKEMFVPRRLRMSAPSPFTKVIVPAWMVREKGLRLRMGHHRVFASEPLAVEQLDNIFVAHYSVRSKAQYESKVLCGNVGLITWTNRADDAARHMASLLASYESGRSNFTQSDDLTTSEKMEERPLNLSYWPAEVLQIRYADLASVNVRRNLFRTAVVASIKAYNLKKAQEENSRGICALVYGTGADAQKMLADCSTELLNVRAFIETSPERRFMMFRHTLVITPELVRFFPYDKIILANSSEYQDMRCLLLTAGVSDDCIVGQDYLLEMSIQAVSGGENKAETTIGNLVPSTISTAIHPEYVIFGAGDFGRRALAYFGADKVAYFVDNSAQRTGQLLQGKRILSFPEYRKIAGRYRTIIAVRHADEMAAQLEHENLSDGYDYFSHEWAPELKRLQEYFKKYVWDVSHITFFGVSKATPAFIYELRGLTNGRSQYNLLDYHDSGHVGEKICGLTVKPFTEEPFAPGCVVISAPDRLMERENVAEHFARRHARVLNPFVPIQGSFEKDSIVENWYIPRKQVDRDLTEEWNRGVEANPNKVKIFKLCDTLAHVAPLFHHVEIETINRCNGKCSFCPVSVGHDTREKHYMSDTLFKKIIDELAALEYTGRLALFSNNEPLLDPEIIARHAYARQALPHARMSLYTNGSLLTIEKYCELLKYLDELIIDNYNQNLKLNPTSQAIYDYCEQHPELKKQTTILIRKENEVMTSRGGDAPNRKDRIRMTTERCSLPFLQMIIRPDGKVSLCCNDPLGKMTLGDVSSQSLEEVWFGPAFREVRKKLLKGRGYMPHCEYCDTFYYG